MSVVNLNQARKARDKAADKALAVENRVKHGRTGADKSQAKQLASKIKRGLDGAKLSD